jgi:hypothetical protein
MIDAPINAVSNIAQARIAAILALANWMRASN